MTIAERHAQILLQLKNKGYVRVTDLANNMDVSLVTIRKDLKTLEERGQLFRAHGSASLRQPNTFEKHVNEKESLHVEEKSRISQQAASLLKAEQAIVIGSGTTCLAFARSLPTDLPLTVLTGAMNISLSLMNLERIELIQLGGMVRKSATSVVGPYAEEMLSHFSCNTLFLGVDGLSPDFGLTTSNALEAHLNKQMIKSVEKTVVLADSSKFGLRGFGKICEVEDIDLLVTDDKVSEFLVKEFEERGVEVLVA
ncbi:MAG: DeoR/GlpR family DNA-binding transcription regulator [Bacteroidota bacterium]